MIVTEWEQGTAEWIKERLGVPSSSNFNKIINQDGSRSKQREKYMYQLAAEKITGLPTDTYKNGYMQKGNEREDESLMFYEITKNVELTKVGFCYKDSEKKFGCSPDALIDFYIDPETGCYIVKSGVETKNKEPHLQVEILDGKEGGFISQHHRQVHGNMLVSGAEIWDLLAYCRGMKQVVLKIERDVKFLDILENELNEFDYDLKKLIERIL